MRETEPGHTYVLSSLDGADLEQTLVFVKRIGDKYPGNEGDPHPGCTTQEVLRALIRRMLYVEKQEVWEENGRVIVWLRRTLRALEHRAAKSRGVDYFPLGGEPEMDSVCGLCGHTFCSDDICPRGGGAG